MRMKQKGNKDNKTNSVIKKNNNNNIYKERY